MLKAIRVVVLLPSALLIASGFNSPVTAESLNSPEIAPPPRDILYQRDFQRGPQRTNQQLDVLRPSIAASSSLNFEAAIRAVKEMQSLPSGYISYQGLQNVDFNPRGCWLIDQQGRRIDLSSLCSGR